MRRFKVDLNDQQSEYFRRIEERFHLAMLAGKMGTWDRDLPFVDGHFSPSALEILGVDPPDGKMDRAEFRALVHPEDREKVEKEQDAAIADEREYRSEYRIIRPDGEVRWVLSAGSPFRDPSGKMISFLGVAMDVTEQKKNEQLLEEHRAKMVASAKLSALGEMAGGIAHEINNPLTIIHGNAGLLKTFVRGGTLDPAQILKIAEKIEETSIRISNIIKSLRSLSRDREKEPFQEVLLQDVFDDTLELCQERFKNRGISLRVASFDPATRLHCRPGQISQVLLNLLNNAFDAVEKLKEKWVEIDVKNLESWLCVSVIDSGNGVPVEIREKILQPFFTTKEVGKGTGLGLSISKALIEAHLGTLQLEENHPNTCFMIRVPMKQTQASSSAHRP